MNPRPKHSEEKLTPTLTIGEEKQPADPTGWTPKRQGEGVYSLREGDQLAGKRTLNTDYEVQEGGKRQVSYVFLALGVLTLVAIVFMTVWLFKKQAGLRAASARSETDPSRVLLVSDDVIVGVSAKDWKGALPLEAAEGFTRATTVEERLKWVRDPARVEPLVRAFFSDGPGAQESVASLVPQGSVRRLNIHYELFRADLAGGRTRVVCVLLTDDGGKVDFESYARHGSVPWEDLLSGRATAAEEVRLFVSLGDYYNFEFSDEGQWRCFVARTPDLDEDLQIYARIGSPVETTLSELTARGPGPVTVAVRSVGQSHERRLFEATRVLAPAWVVP